MTCSVRKTKGKEYGDCPLQMEGESTCGDVLWCSNCGIIVHPQKGYGEPEILIPQFDNQTGGPA